MSGAAANGSSAVAGLIALRLRGRDLWYAILYLDPPADEDPVYRHGTASSLYVDAAGLVADLTRDAIPVDEDAGGMVDVDHARALIGFEMSRDDIDAVITAWNALDDLTKSLGVPLGFSGRWANRCYDKLFWGLNLESLTPPGERYAPTWRRRELAKIDQVLRECGARVAASADNP